MSDLIGPIHLVGIGGVHMSAIAILLRERGIEVTGSDLRASGLTRKAEAAGARVFIGHDAANVGGARLVVTTAAAQDDNPEIVEAKRRDIPVILRAEMVARLMDGKRVIAVAGAHGKTTTSSFIAYILREAGRQPMYLLGGESIDLGGHAAWGEGDLCVVEADEYKRAFHEYQPAIAVITNVEADHLDYYGTEAAYHEAFEHFAGLVRERLLLCADDEGSRALAGLERQSVTELYGTASDAGWQARNVHRDENGAAFELWHEGERMGEIAILAPGEHFVRNATAAAAVCIGEGVAFEHVRAALGKVRGAHRRFERVGERRGVIVMDDYAHHPTEARNTIAAARAAFPGQKLIVVYQPHTYSRIAYLWDEWRSCWDGVDDLIVLETYAAREKPEAGRSAHDLATAIARPATQYAATFEEAVRLAVHLSEPGAVIFTMGAGDVVEAGPMILEALR